MILEYHEFLLEKQLIRSRRDLAISVFERLEKIQPILTEAIEMVELGIFDNFTLETFSNFTEEELNENLFKIAKEKLEKAKETIKQKGKDALSNAQQKIIKFGGDVSKVIKTVIKQIQDAVKSAFDAGKSIAQKAIAKGKEKISKAIGEIKDPKKLSEELKNGKAMLAATAKWITSGFSKEAAGAMSKAAKDSGKETKESFNPIYFELMITEGITHSIKSGEINLDELINEGGEGPKIPFISTIAAKLNEYPPFKQLYAIKNKTKKLVGGGLEKFSVWATDVAGAPGPYKFIALATIIGILVEMEVKGVGKKLLKFALHGIPGVGTIISVAATVAKYLAYIAIIETVLSEVQGEEDPKKEPEEA